MTIAGLIEILRRFPQDSEIHFTIRPLVRVGNEWLPFNCPTEDLPPELREAADANAG